MTELMKLGDVEVDVVYKDIKNVHLSVHPPTGRVRLAAPVHTRPETLRAFAISRLPWIRKQHKRLGDQDRETPREYLNRESHYLWGRRYLLQVQERDAKPTIETDHHRMVMRIRPGTPTASRDALMARFYREQIRDEAPDLIEHWQKNLGVTLKSFSVQKMRTMWGSCTPARGTIRLNTELAKKPRECLEYIIVHELTHLIEPTHNARFVQIMDQAMPGWRLKRELLNQLPVKHEDWRY